MSKTPALSRIDIPEHHKTNAFARESKWFTWSDDFIRFIDELRRGDAFRRRVKVIDIPACQPYGATYHTHLERLTGKQIDSLLRFTGDLMRLSPRSGAYMFHGMLAPKIDSKEIRILFALLREAMIRLMKDDAAALYSPVTQERKDLGFNLHADLFLTTRLWLIFDDVPPDNSGASLLLPRKKLFKIMTKLEELPPQIAGEISTLMLQPLHQDSFNRLYNLLHGDEHRWREKLEDEMKRNVYQMTFRTGEGYLVDDRNWLHGRTAVSKRVSSRRFHRLTFGGRNA